MQVEARIADSDFSRRYVRVDVEGRRYPLWVWVDRNGMALGVSTNLSSAVNPCPESHAANLKKIDHALWRRAEQAAEAICPRLD